MAAAFALTASSKPGDGQADQLNTSLPYGSLLVHCADCRTWKSILRALQHPTYTTPSLKPVLISRIPKLQNCADAYPLTKEQSALSGCTVTIDGIKYDITSQQKELTNKLAKEVQLDFVEACKIVLQQSRVGVVELDGVVKAYMEERTALLRIVKCLVRMDVYTTANVKSGALAKEVLAKIKRDKEFTSKLVQGVRKRVGQQLPPKVNSDPSTGLLWSRQVRALLTNSNGRYYWRNMNYWKSYFWRLKRKVLLRN